MAKILLLYSTINGHTAKICETIKQHCPHHSVQLSRIELADTYQLSDFDAVIIGGSIRYGRHRQNVHQFIEQNYQQLNKMPSAFFSVNLVARKPQKASAETNPYVKKLLKKIHWQPSLVGVFAGKLNYPAYSTLDKWIIRLIMKMTGGPTDLDTIKEFTDWQQVKDFSEKFIEILN